MSFCSPELPVSLWILAAVVEADTATSLGGRSREELAEPCFKLIGALATCTFLLSGARIATGVVTF